MTFRLSHTVTFPCSFDHASDIVCRSSTLPALQQISPDCTQCILTSPSATAQEAATDSSQARSNVPNERDIPSISTEDCIAALNAHTLPTHLPWPPFITKTSKREAFEKVDADLTSFTFKEGRFARVNGIQAAWHAKGIVLFHSQVRSAGIEEWKLRVLERVDGGSADKEEVTRVTETVWGSAPAWLAWFLKVSGMAQNAHRGHMELYHKLLET